MQCVCGVITVSQLLRYACCVRYIKSPGTETSYLKFETSGLTSLSWEPSATCPIFFHLGFYLLAARKWRKSRVPFLVRIMSLLGDLWIANSSLNMTWANITAENQTKTDKTLKSEASSVNLRCPQGTRALKVVMPKQIERMILPLEFSEITRVAVLLEVCCSEWSFAWILLNSWSL